MPKTLLLADDSVTIQKVVGIVFATEDYRVVPVDNGEDALRKARELRPDVVLADAVMPRMNGYELCQAVKADPQLADVPVLLLAGTFEPFDEARARAARADGHIAKPFDTQSLLARVRELVEGVTVEPMPLPYPKAAAAAPPPPQAAPRMTPPPAPRRA
ncbi:MAG: response regulator, partial [Anaeromyxobacteraceae bacterium]